MASLNCTECSAAFTVPRYREATARFCSRRCASAWHAVRSAFTKGPRPWLKGNKFRAGKRPTNAFEPGHATWNAGMKGIHLSPASEFKKGCVSLTKMPLGTVVIRTRHKRRGEQRAFVKVGEPNKWLLRAHYVWIAAHGPIPRGMVIHHIDRDKLNDDLANLSLESKASHMIEHIAEIVASRR